MRDSQLVKREEGFVAAAWLAWVAANMLVSFAMKTSELITTDPDVLGGTPVFKGTRVPVKTLFEYLERNYTLDEFLECFPSVTREQACRVLEVSESALLAPVAT